ERGVSFFEDSLSFTPRGYTLRTLLKVSAMHANACIADIFKPAETQFIIKRSGLQKIPAVDIECGIHNSMSESQDLRTTTIDQAMNKGNVLIIDDEPDILTVLKKTLQIGGYSTYGFVSPIAALEHYRKNSTNYRVVISDVRMPAMSGFQLAREIRNLNPKVKIILMTA